MRIVIADDHPTILAGIEALLGPAPRLQVVGRASSVDELLALLSTTPCEAVVTDFAMPGGRNADGLALLSQLCRHPARLQVVLHTMLELPTTLAQARRLGVRHMVGKADASGHLAAALQAAGIGAEYYSPAMQALLERASGSGSNVARPLTPGEQEVVRLFVSGMTVNAIATQLHRSKQTVSARKMNAMRKLGLTHDAELVKAWLDLPADTPGAAS
ncbi:response regulator transcription factor [Stenotrophomonas tumulicola]|uniref:Response regulator transcription factor n=1 Tax=Stenotrophomonas tumulicola TaxID=1685415 RepID=A0A7W3FQ03_9GAMM|nr:response regulator transcription factor [Stenotrophomonas tumulicola]MBA8683609.1 response regulator transcription factor [Stenotrophomonas tumulicola]